MNDLAVQGKHIDLVPQKRTEERRTTATSPTGTVSWGQNDLSFGPGGSVEFLPGGVISFGPGGVRLSGVSVMGAPINPATQRVVPGMDVTDRVEVWVSFMIEDHRLNATDFCKMACRETRKIVTDFSNQFGL